MNSKVASFDVFDTTVTRFYADPADLHVHQGEILFSKGFISAGVDFQGLRMEAERLAWSEGGGRNGASIDSIYSHLAKSLGWSTTQALEALQLEVTLEQASCRAIPDAISKIRRARSNGDRVCFVSDMHLRGDQIRGILMKVQAIESAEKLWVSSDYAALKSTGELFQRVIRDLGASPNQIRHSGDSRDGDVKGARRSGLRSDPYFRAHLNRFERLVRDRFSPEDWRGKSLATVSRMSRLSRLQCEPDSDLWDLLCSTVAPFVVAYALWLIRQAQSRGIRKLFFLARDMQIVHRVAKQLIASMGLNMECVYIHASRISWQRAGYSGPSEFDLSWISNQVAGADPVKMLLRILPDGSEERILGFIRKCGMAEGDWSCEDLRRFLLIDEVRAWVESETKCSRQALISYLREHGYSPSPDCALVDAGWRGTLQRSLARAFQREGDPGEVIGFYIGLRHQTDTEAGNSLIPFLDQGTLDRLGFSLISMIESFLIANHGSTLRFVKTESDKVVPVLGSSPSPVLLDQWELVREASEIYAKELIESPAWQGLGAGLEEALRQPLLELCAFPSNLEAGLLQRWKIDLGWDGVSLRQMVGPIVLKDFGKLVVARIRSTPFADVYLSSPWSQGSIASSPFLLRRFAKMLAVAT